MKKIATMIMTGIMAAVISMTAFAGEWKADQNGWWYDNGNGTWPANCWQWIDGNNDGTAECYYFNQQGYCLLNTVTPDGYTVNADGAWTTNGILQTKFVGQYTVENEDYLGKHDDSQSITSVLAVDLVTDAYANDCIYTVGKSEKTEITCMYRIPRVNLSSSDVEKINSEIYSSLSPIIEDAVVEIDEYGYPCTSNEIIYYWSVNGDVLSLVIRNSSYPDFGGGYEYMVYNISVSTGNRLSKNELISVARISPENYHDTLWQALGSAYFQDKESCIAQMGYDDFFRTQLEKTLSEDNIQNCVPYFNEDGQLCIIGAIYLLGEADFYYHEINLGNFVINAAFSEYMETQANAVNSDAFAERYKAILLQHPESTPFSWGSNTIYIDTEYTLYDVDKNGIPELIVKEDGSKYYIYSFNGTDVISSDVCYWSYGECLYEYEGNGIAIHDGGRGSMRIEYVSLYSMVNNKLVWSEELMSTDECSFDELYSFLDSLTPINDFHSITDDSYLFN
ncbi:MAG: hypothetical protein Q4E24_01485 [bacterium]|nr:hypothetical protein [bacterium]